MKKKMLLIVLSLVCALTCAFGLAACDDGTTDGSGNGGTDNNGGTQTVAVESVTLDETTLTLDIGDEETLTATVAPDNATNKTVTWSSDNTAVATVANGKVTAVAAGTATITATADGKNATCAVTVNAPITVDYTVMADEWETAFSEQIKVYTITAEQDGYSAPMVQKFDFNRNIFYLTAMGVFEEDAENAGRITHMIITKEGDNFYYYTSLDAQTWERESITEDEYSNYANQFGNGLTVILSGLKEKYNSFSFSDDSYGAENVELPPIGIMNEATVKFENGQLKSLDFVIDNAYMKMSQHIDFGVAEIEIPTEFTEKAPSTITGNYHNIVKGETGWMLNTSSTFVFNDDGTCEVGVSATYTVENGIVTITASVEGNSITIFATVDGNIMYLFQSKDEVTDVQNSTQFLYNGNEISPDDLAKITEIFGDGVMDMGGKD